LEKGVASEAVRVLRNVDTGHPVAVHVPQERLVLVFLARFDNVLDNQSFYGTLVVEDSVVGWHSCRTSGHHTVTIDRNTELGGFVRIAFGRPIS
jgi:hypothetical protein